MKTRKELTQKVALPIGGEEETMIFPEFVRSAGYSYAATLLRSYGKTVSTVGDNKTYMYRSTTQKSKRGGRATDVYSGWIERKAMLNRASKWGSTEQVNEVQRSK